MKKLLLVFLNNCQWGLKSFYQLLLAHQKKTIAILSSLLILVMIGSFSLITGQERIRQRSIENTVYQKMQAEALTPLKYPQADEKIQQTKNISVMFSPAKGATFEQVLKTMKQAEGNQDLSGEFYYYPIVYDSQTIAKKYQLNPKEVTFIYFKAGKEKNRFVVEDLRNFERTFIPKLNRLSAVELN